MKYSRLILFLFFFTITSCSNSLKDTITDIKTTPNEIISIYNDDNQKAKINIISYISDTGDLTGITLYGSLLESDLNAIQEDDINNYFPDITKKKNLLSINNPTNINYLSENKQLTTISNVNIPSNAPYFIVSTSLFKNSIYAVLNSNEGYFENQSSKVFEVYPKTKKELTMTNFNSTIGKATGSIEYNSNDVILSGVGNIQLVITMHTINSVPYGIPSFQSTKPNTLILSKGAVESSEIDRYDDMSHLNFSNSATIVKNNMYFIKYNNDYFKVYVKTTSLEPSAITSSTTNYSIDIDVFYSKVLNANKL